VLGDQPVAVVRLVHREQGLIVAAGNPLGLGGIEDLTRPGVALCQPPAWDGDARAARP
jgi:putative molybdopterin biosynthesis protein